MKLANLTLIGFLFGVTSDVNVQIADLTKVTPVGPLFGVVFDVLI